MPKSQSKQNSKRKQCPKYTDLDNIKMYAIPPPKTTPANPDTANFMR